MAFFVEAQRHQARERRLRIMDTGAGFAGGKETSALLRQLERESED